MLKQNTKQTIGNWMLRLCDSLPWAKPLFQPWGLRTAKEWFADRVVGVQWPNGRSFKLASVSENYLSFELFWRGAGYYEPITTLVVQELARPGDTFIDVGANIGFYSLALATLQPRIPIIAFEPNPKNFALLQANIRANQFQRIRCEPAALSDADGTAVLYLSASDMSASLEDDFDAHPTGTLRITTTTLDNYLVRQPVAGRLLIKVDVEGHEESFFSGARQTISERKPDLITEVTFDHGEEVTSFLKATGYRFYQITDQGLVESPELTPVIREPFVFLNYLLSSKPRKEISDLFGRIKGRVQRIDLTQTSKCVDRAMIRKLRGRRQRSRAPLAAP